jgi:hypothetical protein
MPKRSLELHLEPEGTPSAPGKRILKRKHAIHLLERFAERAPITFAILGLHADLLDKRAESE